MEDKLPKIYSKQAIVGFSIFFSPLFGGILLFKNLIEVQKKKEAYLVLATSIILTIIIIVFGEMQENVKSSYAYLCGLIGGTILAYGFFPVYFPNEAQYEKKNIWIPLLTGLLIALVFVAIIIYSGSL
ncbi:hypothetical protein SAMN05880574_11040 [Chryseobacterium sp. RU37D]|uniref:hypothetical protein n=1 Tax=Chryseobacterium sp. RU37D TaxID=1907397 RepID=UPI0009570AF3|nr:hypothetical protein [Chryseobacterium sp. RU37D]SIQ32320.1 hypothetical protein SAMN05880574_11040 [Chryseobacterium sp. RU37D]